jgi:peptide deformylase
MDLKLAYYGNPVLRRKCESIEEVTDEHRALAKEMLARLEEWNAWGMSAPQVHRSIRLFVVRMDPFRPDGSKIIGTPYVCINPRLSDPTEEMLLGDEGCCSLPGLRVPVFRPQSITIDALDINGEPFTFRPQDWHARLFMHENDHLNGVLHIDRTDPQSRKRLEPALRRMKKKYNP